MKKLIFTLVLLINAALASAQYQENFDGVVTMTTGGSLGTWSSNSTLQGSN